MSPFCGLILFFNSSSGIGDPSNVGAPVKSAINAFSILRSCAEVGLLLLQREEQYFRSSVFGLLVEFEVGLPGGFMARPQEWQYLIWLGPEVE